MASRKQLYLVYIIQYRDERIANFSCSGPNVGAGCTYRIEVTHFLMIEALAVVYDQVISDIGDTLKWIASDNHAMREL